MVVLSGTSTNSPAPRARPTACGERPIRRVNTIDSDEALLHVKHQKLPNEKRFWSAMKNSRFSGKNVSNALRFTTAGSTSTCPKSGLNVALSIRSEVSEYLRSAPTRYFDSCSSANGSSGSRSATDSLWATTYGSSSRRPTPALGAEIPSRCPNRWGPPDWSWRQNDHIWISLLRLMSRVIWRPQVWSAPALNLSCENGILSSAVHPSSPTSVSALHTGSHDESPQSSSRRAPAGLIRKVT